MKLEDQIKIEQNLFKQEPANDLSNIIIEDLARDYLEIGEHLNEKKGGQNVWELIKEYEEKGAFTSDDSLFNFAKALMRTLETPGMMHKIFVIYRETNGMEPFPYREKLPKKYQIGL